MFFAAHSLNQVELMVVAYRASSKNVSAIGTSGAGRLVLAVRRFESYFLDFWNTVDMVCSCAAFSPLFIVPPGSYMLLL